jgi:asparagine synthetase B (glutamine-hydrolysing)
MCSRIPRKLQQGDPEEALRAFDELLDGTVARDLCAGRTGVFLSGGVDSGLVAASATAQLRRNGNAPPLALSLKFPRPESDEEEAQRAVAADLGLDHVVVRLDGVAGADGVLLAGVRLGERSWLPSMNPWNFAYDRLASMAREAGCEAILTGEGGNELLDPRAGSAADDLLRGDLRALVALWKVEQSYRRRSSVRMARDLILGKVVQTLLRHALTGSLYRLSPTALRWAKAQRARRALPTWFAPDPGVRRELVERRAAPIRYDDARGPYAQALRRSLDSAQRSILLESTFQIVRSATIEVRNPLYDAQLFRFAHLISPQTLSLGARVKGLAYESYRRRTQGATANRMRVVWFHRYFEELLEREAPNALSYLGGLRCLEQLGVVTPGVADAIRRGSPSLTHSDRWNILAAEGWLRARLL